MEETRVGETSDPAQEDVGRVGAGAVDGSQLQMREFGSGGGESAGTGGGGGNCKGLPAGGSKKRSRSAPWTVTEMLTLIEAKKEERERCKAYKSQGVKLPAAEKWRIVATHMESQEMGRSGSQCQDKWENMMKDYKAVREWQYVGSAAAKDYFKDMTNKERKDASLPPQMDEIVFYSLDAIQSEKEEKKDRLVRWKERSEFVKTPLPTPTPVIIKDKVCSSNGNDVESIDTDSTRKRFRRGKKLQQDQTQLQMQQQQPQPTRLVSSDQSNPVVLNDFVQRQKDGSKELIDCFLKVLERNDKRPDVDHNATKPKDTATLARVLVALADAVKAVAQKL